MNRIKRRMNKPRVLQRLFWNWARTKDIHPKHGLKFLTAVQQYFNDPTLTHKGAYTAIATIRDQEKRGATPELEPGTGRKRKKHKEFYESVSWLRLRYEALTVYSAICMCCGGKERIHVDHIRPRSRYPHLELVFNNLQILCRDCNIGKEAWDETDWRPEWAKEKYPLPPQKPRIERVERTPPKKAVPSGS